MPTKHEPKIKEDVHVLADFYNGKFTKDHKNVRSKAQKGPSCILYSSRKLFTFFDENHSVVNQSEYYKAYKMLKHMFAIESIEDKVGLQLKTAEAACKLLHINKKEVILKSSKFKQFASGYKGAELERCYHEELSPQFKFEILYQELQRRIFQSFGIVPGSWKPDDGVEELKQTLIIYGAILVSGKYGRSYYNGNPTENYPLSSQDRKVHAFAKSSCTFVEGKFNHAVILDEVRKVTIGSTSVDMVFFRDPNHLSVPSLRENIYAQSYESFAARIKLWDEDLSNPVYIYHQADDELRKRFQIIHLMYNLSIYLNPRPEEAQAKVSEVDNEEEEDNLKLDGLHL